MNSTRFHEAAHAVIALAYGARVSRLAMGSGSVDGLLYSGITTFLAGALPRDKQAEIYLAGPVAEKVLDSYWNVDEVKNDYERAVQLLGRDDPKPIVERCRRRVYNLWPPRSLAWLRRFFSSSSWMKARSHARRGCRRSRGTPFDARARERSG